MKHDGGPAFPCEGNYNGGPFNGGIDFLPSKGMSLRDYLAGQIVNGMMAGDASNGWHEMSRKAYEYADVMLAERDKEPA